MGQEKTATCVCRPTAWPCGTLVDINGPFWDTSRDTHTPLFSPPRQSPAAGGPRWSPLPPATVPPPPPPPPTTLDSGSGVFHHMKSLHWGQERVQ